MIKVDENLFTDVRYKKLLELLGDEFRAIGSLVVAWKLAREYWVPKKKTIPEDDWFAANLPDEIFQAELATRRADGSIYMKGSEERFSTEFARITAGRIGGIKSGEARRAKKQAQTAEDRVDTQWVAKLWNECCGTLPKVKAMSQGRLRSLQARLKDFPKPETWQEAIDKIRESEFCNGKNDRGWKASFDWLLQTQTIERVIEGKYDRLLKTKTFADKRQDKFGDMYSRVESGEL